jgi:hypothetical protein
LLTECRLLENDAPDTALDAKLLRFITEPPAEMISS